MTNSLPTEKHITLTKLCILTDSRVKAKVSTYLIRMFWVDKDVPNVNKIEREQDFRSNAIPSDAERKSRFSSSDITKDCPCITENQFLN